MALLAIGLVLGACTPERGARFQHVTHAGAGLTCKSCHAGILEAKTVEIRHMPQEKRCSTCHVDPHRGKTYVGSCVRCHGGDPHDEPRAMQTSQHLRFSHASHLSRSFGQCFPCHSAVAQKTPKTARLLPGHPQCLTCHDKQFKELDCNYCHRDLRIYPPKPIAEFAHAGDFLRTHGRLASSRAELCAQCHTQPYCANCHDPNAAVLRPSIRWPEQVDRTFIHRGDYVGRHAIEARTAGDSCVRCHARKECTDCHAQRGVGQGAGRTPHPEGWVSVTGGPNLHGPAARREIVSCAGCHDQGAQSNCVRCHRVGGVGGNPHPPGWRTRQSKGKDRVCRVCHG